MSSFLMLIISLNPFSQMLNISSCSSTFFLRFSSQKLKIFSNLSLKLSSYSLFSLQASSLALRCFQMNSCNLRISSFFSFLTISTRLLITVSMFSFSLSVFLSCLIWNWYPSSFSANSFLIPSISLFWLRSDFSLFSNMKEILFSSASSCLAFHLSISLCSSNFSLVQSSPMKLVSVTFNLTFSSSDFFWLSSLSFLSISFCKLVFCLSMSSYFSQQSSALLSLILARLRSSCRELQSFYSRFTLRLQKSMSYLVGDQLFRRLLISCQRSRPCCILTNLQQLKNNDGRIKYQHFCTDYSPVCLLLRVAQLCQGICYNVEPCAPSLCFCQVQYLVQILMWFLITLIVLAVIIGLVWSYFNFTQIKIVPISSNFSIQDELHNINYNQGALGIVEIGSIIHEGATEFIVSEYKTCSVFIGIIAVIVWACVDKFSSGYTTFAFLVGAVTSMACGAFGMHIATLSNFRTTICAKISLGSAFKVAYRAGVVIGFALVSVSLITLLLLISLYKNLLGLQDSSKAANYYDFLFESIAGFGLGGSTIALFARVGGGIFTKAADLGSDLVGKIESGLPEDSPRNPATIADNVGDNVGDIAGMGADLFGSFAESTCASLIIGCNSITNHAGVYELNTIMYVLLIPAIGIFVSLVVSSFITEADEITQGKDVEKSLKKQLVYSTLLLLPCLWMASYMFLHTFKITIGAATLDKDYNHPFFCLSLGLVGGLIIGYVTEIMTSYTYNPVQELSQACKMGPATNIIYGLALGYFSTIIPVIVLCLVCYFSHTALGFYGVSLAALGMLSNLPICLAIDSYGPVSDNAGGIAEMAELPSSVRQRTDILDSAGNTTAAIGKGFAIGSATLVGFALYGAFLHTAHLFGLKENDVSFNDPIIFTSLLFGSMIPYAFSAMTIKSVGHAALGMIEEVRRQIRVNPGILDGTTRPDYKACVRMSTKAALRDLVKPGLLVTVTPFALGYFFGPKALIGFLPGAIVSGVQMAISASNTGGAWDNAKKYIQAGLMRNMGQVVPKGSDIHKAAVIGDTVGDPLKDTSGPSLNILIKLMSILSLVFCPYFSQ